MTQFGKGFERTNLFRMIRFAELFSDEQIVATLSPQLSWSHFVEILVVKDELARKFYTEMCRLERWSVRTLRDKINGMLFERTALSRKPEELIRQELAALTDADSLTPDMVFRDPYLLNFLGLVDTFSEKELSDAILREIERFLLEMGRYFQPHEEIAQRCRVQDTRIEDGILHQYIPSFWASATNSSRPRCRSASSCSL